MLLSFDAQIDDIYHIQNGSIFKNSPFGSLLGSHEINDWNRFRELVCNLHVQNHNRVSHRNKVEIALTMHYQGDNRQIYTFKPNYTLMGEECMILQTRAFLLGGGSAEEITMKQYFGLSKQKMKSVTLAREITFGPMGDNSDRDRCICFDICNQIPEAPFYITETLDDDAHQLIKDILECYMVDEDSFSSTKIQETLKKRFENIMFAYSAWSWPSNANGYGPSNIAAVRTKYHFNEKAQTHLKTLKLWKSFVDELNDVSTRMICCKVQR